LYELIGYAASVLIAISLTMRSILRLRVINLVGAAFFVLYGLLISAYPVAVLNALIVGINLYYLREMRRAESYFTILETDRDSAYLREFLDYYEEDIRRFFPSFDFSLPEGQMTWFVLRDLVPVGLFVAEQTGPDRLLVHLDYVIPGYRDLKPGRFLYHHQAGRFRSRGISCLETVPETREQRDYIERVGFEPVAESPETYVRSVPGG
jgi:hypothetical protein